MLKDKNLQLKTSAYVRGPSWQGDLLTTTARPPRYVPVIFNNFD